MAAEHARWNLARHRQHEIAIADDPFLGGLPDNPGRYARTRSRADPAIRDAWRRLGIADRLSHQHICDGVVPVFGARARHSQNQRTSDSMDDVRRYPQSRRGLLFFAAAVSADDQHFYSLAGAVRNRGSGRLRHRRPA